MHYVQKYIFSAIENNVLSGRKHSVIRPRITQELELQCINADSKMHFLNANQCKYSKMHQCRVLMATEKKFIHIKSLLQKKAMGIMW